MSKVYEFAISRKLSIVLALCCTLVAILLFVAGTMSGLLLSPRYAAYSAPKSKIEVSASAPSAPKPASVEPQQSPCGSSPASPATAPSAPAQATSAEAAPTLAPKPGALNQTVAAAGAGSSPSGTIEVPGLVAAAGNPQKTGMVASPPAPGATGSVSAGAPVEAGTPAKPAAPPPPDPYAVSLVVQVGSFTVEDNATRLAESLRQLGYPAEIVQRTDSHQRLWYVVRLGPYREWNAASGVAMRLAANQELKPIVGPM